MLISNVTDESEREEARCVARLVGLFNTLFFASFNTILVKGKEGVEPLYMPARAPGMPNRIVFAHGFFSSALHETAHWCIAGAERRTKTDFGYWYRSDGRTACEQCLFEAVEAKPQALEWIFTKASGRTFRLSADNLDRGLGPSESFKRNVYASLCDWWKIGLNQRSEAWMVALATAFNRGRVPSADDFCYLELS